MQDCRCSVVWQVALSSMPMARVQDTNAAWRPVDVPVADRCTQARDARRTVPRLVHQTSAAFISAASRLPDNTRIGVEGESGETV